MGGRTVDFVDMEHYLLDKDKEYYLEDKMGCYLADKGHHWEDSQQGEHQDRVHLIHRMVGGRRFVAEDKLVEVEGMVTARGQEDTESGCKEQADNLPESGDRWGRGGHCRQGAEELTDSQTQTFSCSLCLCFCILYLYQLMSLVLSFVRC